MKASHKLSCERREKTGKRYAERERASGRLPTVLYGRGRPPVHLSLEAKQALKFFTSGERVFTIEVGSDGTTQLVMLKDVQFNYLGDEVIHADLVRVELDDIVDSHVPITWTGEARGLKTPGAILMHQMDSIHVQAKVRDMPEEIVVDVSELDANEVIHISDIDIPSNLEYQGEPEDVVASIIIKAEIDEEEGTEAETVEGIASEPEVISEAKDEDEGEEESSEEKG